MTPHPANVRRRIRQLKDYITVSADWVSYALIDDITDAFGPLIHSLEKEVDDTHDAILRMHVGQEASDAKSVSASHHGEDDGEQKSDGEMLKRVGDSRRNVTSLYRLMGNKADVIKGFAKRCNQQWEVAPRSEIGLYLGDIQGEIDRASCSLLRGGSHLQTTSLLWCPI
jgi:magnesium transporter